jgi:hypothetical protein
MWGKNDEAGPSPDAVVDTVRLPHGQRQTQDQTVLSATRSLMLYGVLFKYSCYMLRLRIFSMV